MNLLKNKHGATLVYILAGFMIISFIGVALTKLAHHDTVSMVNYSSLMSAREAALSGIQATEDFIREHSDSTLAILSEYIDMATKAPVWILGDTTSANRVVIDGQLSFATQLVSFAYATGSDNFAISIKSYGYGKGGSRKTAISAIDLGGIEWNIVSSNDTVATAVPALTEALYLGQGAGEIIGQLKVMRGGVYVETPNSFFVADNGAHEFHGYVRTASATSGNFKIKACHFYEAAHFRFPVLNEGGATMVFDKGVGFEQLYSTVSPTFIVNGVGAFFNGGFSGGASSASTCGPVMNGYLVQAWNAKTYSTDDVSGDMLAIAQGEGAGSAMLGDSIDIATKLSVPTYEPNVPVFDISVIPNDRIHSAASLGHSPDGNTLNSWCNDASKAKWNGYLVVSGKPTNNGSGLTFGNSGTFNGKVIWIIHNGGALQAPSNGMFNMANSARFLLYVTGDTRFNNFRLSPNFRGVILGNSNSGLTQNFFTYNNSVHGAIAFQGSTFRLQNDAGSFDVYYDSTVVNDIAGTGIFGPSTVDSIVTVSDTVLDLSMQSITPSKLSLFQ